MDIPLYVHVLRIMYAKRFNFNNSKSSLMKKFLLSALCAFSTTAFVQAQVAQLPLVEHFTQASCGPCASQNPALYATLGTFGSANYSKITYQVSWPGVDIMNAEYAAGPNDRRNYYGVSGVPNASLNGGAVAGPNAAVTSSTLASAGALMTPYDIAITQTWTSLTNVDLTIVISNVTGAAISTADRFHLAMIEENITFPTAPGSNGETAFFNVVRDMYDASTGASSTAGATIGAIPANGNITFTMSVTPPAYVRDKNQISFIGYVQNNASQAVQQSGKSVAGNVPGLLGVAATSNTTVGAGYCDYNFTPSITFTNNGSVPVTTVTGEYTINGGTPVSVTVGGLNLGLGQSTPIAFAAGTLVGGTSLVEYSITDVNNGGTFSQGPVTMAPENYSKLNTTSTAAPVMETMENATLPAGEVFTRDLSTAIFDAPATIPMNRFGILDGPAAGVGQVGGNAASDRSIYINFFNITSGSMNLTFHKLNFTSASQLTFDHAYAQYQNENDRLEVEVSTDCGATWTSVFNKAGSVLATVPAQTGNFVPSAANQWDANTVDLSAYDNMNDVVVRFKATSAYGNNLLLDNINFSQATNVVAVQQEAAEVQIMPNPVSNQMTLEFTMLNTADANINIVNALGQQVQQVTSGSFSGTNVIEVNTSDFAAGVYFVNITTKEGTTTTRFVRQ